MSAPFRSAEIVPRCGALACLGIIASCRVVPLHQESGMWTPGSAWHQVVVGGITREFLFHVPLPSSSNVSRAGALPLVIVLHGSGDDANGARAFSHMDAAADTLGFLVAYPNGRTDALTMHGSDWNAGACCGFAARNHVDDVAFLRALIDGASLYVPIDRRRIYVAGFSDGGRMAHRAACDMADAVAAIGVVSGSLVDAECAPTRAVPVVAFHGTADEDVPYNDSALTQPPRPVPPPMATLPPSIRFWAAQNQCDSVTNRPYSAHVTRALVVGCGGSSGGGDIAFYTLIGGVHAWPGPDQAGVMGEVAATDVMVGFFLAHKR